MTNAQRARVVELLRCAADCNRFYVAAYWLGHCDANRWSRIASLASNAFYEIHGHSVEYWNNPRACFLEAAARVEEGRWP